MQCSCLKELVKDVERFTGIEGEIEDFDWGTFFKSKSVDYRGEEVKEACRFCWDNISPALPKEIGVVALEDACSLGARHYVLHFEQYLKPESEWGEIKSPKVMVEDRDWPGVCRGLLESGVCTLLPVEDVFSVRGSPLLNGLFGVSKDEVVNGYEVYRLIMNLIPLNSLCQGLSGDVQTLPSWSLMNPMFLQPTETLLISSEDVRCFFYVMRVPSNWHQFLAFNKKVPQDCLPDHLLGREVYLASRVLPMGFLNSVSLAQHVHRNLVLDERQDEVNPAEAELRKDRPFTVANPSWRVYLDNYDLLERVKSVDVGGVEGTVAPGVLSLKGSYELWNVPRNVKKSVSRQVRAEVQGAQVDGDLGVAYPRSVKLLKYVGAALSLCSLARVSQRQVQVVCGGLVYVSMFRRPLLGCLNAVWTFVESFNNNPGGGYYRPLPVECREEVLRFVALMPLARIEFRLEMTSQVTCSDASTTGGGLRASTGITRMGALASYGRVRGELPEAKGEHSVLSVGLFDGIGALRVALDLLEVQVAGHISVETNGSANRVVESHFPGTISISHVELVDEALVQRWAGEFSQVSLVLLWAGPPCQGVSGLNAERKGALKDARSSLFIHVKRIEELFKAKFPWAQVRSLMESVASMDQKDMEIMSSSFGSYPWRCDAGTMLWCSRPRYYWVDWTLQEGEGVTLQHVVGGPSGVILVAHQEVTDVCREGWRKVDASRPFPTFTTSRPRSRAGYKPAGVHQCSWKELQRWSSDLHRFPPYQYMEVNSLVNRKGDFRLPEVEEKEYMMGFPVGFTSHCLPKSERKKAGYLDVRHTLVGNSWAVPVVAWLLGQLLSVLGLCREFSPQDLVDKLKAKNNTFLQSRLLRMPLHPLRGSGEDRSLLLVQQLGNLVSVKGEDILLVAKTSEQVKFHRLRASVPSRLWKWKIIAGWQWSNTRDHINVLELRAILTSMLRRIGHQGLVKQRFLHLTDSLVCLHSLTRGRSSSRKLRRTLCRINALQLVSSTQALWGYVHTDQNPADKPSRWGRRVRTKFRHG